MLVAQGWRATQARATPIRPRACVKCGAKRGELDPLKCADDVLLALIDQGLLAFDDAWLTITPAGKAALAQGDETVASQDGEALPWAALPSGGAGRRVARRAA
jgi:hypothetical protein